MNNRNRILVTGGETFLGVNIASALLLEGADVTLLVRPGAEERLGVLERRVRWYAADVWDTASLRGRARGNYMVIHTVGSMVADPARGLTHHRLNVISARNVANMCISDGVPYMMLLSTTAAPWISRSYIRAKREAEQYLSRIGLHAAIVRAPLVYVRGMPRPWFYRAMTALGGIPPISWLGFNRIAPMPMDVLARGTARLALSPLSKVIYYAPDLRRLNRRDELRGQAEAMLAVEQSLRVTSDSALPFDAVDDSTPFGWTP
jgi:uncharacterized protein YbjT (DUF2867 family)